MILIVGKDIYDLRMARSITVYPDEIWIEWGRLNRDNYDQEKIEIPEECELTLDEVRKLVHIFAHYKNHDVIYSLDQLIDIVKQDNIDFGVDTG